MQLKLFKNTKKGFTLAEALLVMIVIGFLTIIAITTLKPETVTRQEKNKFLMAHKAIETMQTVFSQIRQTETEIIPTGTFMTKVPGTANSYEFSILNTNNALASAEEIANLIGDYMKKDGNTIQFCTVTKSCSNTGVKGFKLPGDMYIGIEKFANIINCPSFYMPVESETQNGEVGEPVLIPAPKNLDGTNKQCWGKLHVDINGPKAPNTQNQDYYTFGLDEFGIVTGAN